MTVKGNHYPINSAIHYIDTLKDVMVAAGWQLVGPTDTLINRTAQDDKHARILGWFLQSNGEDGTKDWHVHLHWAMSYNTRQPGGWFNWLTAAITNSQTDSIPIHDATGLATNDIIIIDGEAILIGTVDTTGAGGTADPHYLNGCTRGYGATSPEAHDAEDVLILAYDSSAGTSIQPYFRLYAYRDLTNSIGQSTGTISWSIGDTGNVDPIIGLDGWPSGEAWENGQGLLKINDAGSAHNGQMRWIKTDDGAGRYTYDKFKTTTPGVAVGVYDCDIVSAGWGIPNSNNQQVGASSVLKMSTPFIGPKGVETIAKDVWFVVSKDTITAMHKDGTEFQPFYWGAYKPFSDERTTSAHAVGGGDIAAGALSIDVDDVRIFSLESKYRIMSQSYLDWINNEDRSSDTSMGATAGNWADLEGDEMVQENVYVTGITPGTGNAGTLTIRDPLIYSYKSGAKIGKDPAHFITYINRGNSISYAHQFRTTSGTQFASMHPFHVSSNSRFRVDRPSHRRQDKCTNSTTSWNPWAANGGYDTRGQIVGAYMSMLPTIVGNMDDEENATGDLLSSPFSIVNWDADRSAYGGFVYQLGIKNFVRKIYDTRSGASEDELDMPWETGQEQAFIFYDTTNTQWYVMGPFIWP